MKRYLLLANFLVIAGRSVAMSSVDYEAMYNIAEAEQAARESEKEAYALEIVPPAQEQEQHRKLEEHRQQASEIWKKEVQAADALGNIRQVAQAEDLMDETAARELEKVERAAEQAAVMLKAVTKKVKRAQKIEDTHEWQKSYEVLQDAQAAVDRIERAAAYQDIFENASAKFNIEYAKKQLEEARQLMEEQVRGRHYQDVFEQSSEQKNEEYNKELERKRAAFIEQDKQAAQLRDLIERSADQSGEEWRKSPKHYVDKVVHGLEDLWQQVQASQQHVGAAAAQKAESVKRAISDAITAIHHRMPWKDKVDRAIAATQEWYGQARMQMGNLNSWLAAHAAPVPAGAGADITLGTMSSDQQSTVDQQAVSTYVAGYRKAVKAYEALKKQRSITAAQAQELIGQFNTIRVALNRNLALKLRVNARIVPMIVRAWKGKDVLIGYIDEYIRNIQDLLNNSANKAATAKFQAQFRNMPTAQL